MANLRVQAAPKWNPVAGPQAGFAIIVSVTDQSGAPVNGLQESNFEVQIFDNPDNPVVPAMSSVRAFPTPLGGVYSFGVSKPAGGTAWTGRVVLFAG